MNCILNLKKTIRYNRIILCLSVTMLINFCFQLQAHRETRVLCRNQLAHINRVNFMLSASNKRLRRADKNMRPSGANNNRKCC